MAEFIGNRGTYFQKDGEDGAQENDRILREKSLPIDKQKDLDRKFLYADSSFVSLVDHLKSIEGEPNEQQKKELEKDWEGIAVAELKQIDSLLNDHFLKFKNPYPYDTRSASGWFENMNQYIDKARGEEWGEKPVSKAWLKRIEADSAWGDNSLKLLVGLSGALDRFFDGGAMISEWVRNRFRSDPVASNFEVAFSKDVPGLAVDSEAKKLLSGEASEGMREKAIRYQDDGMYWRMAVSAYHQYDYTKPQDLSRAKSPEELGTVLMDISPVERRFLEGLFALPSKPGSSGLIDVKINGNLIRIPETVMNWHAMSSSEELKRKYIATMQALMIENARENLDLCEEQKADGSRGFNENLLSDLQDRVSKRRDNILAEWFSPEKDYDTMLSGVVAKSGIVYDWGNMNSAPMAWGYDWSLSEEEVDGQKTYKLKKEVTTGGTTASTDSNTPHFWAFNDITTRGKEWPGGLLPSPAEDFILDTKERSPYELAKFDMNKDPEMKRAYEDVWKPFTDKGKTISFPPEVKAWFDKYMWGYKTSLKLNNGENVYLPMFMLPYNKSINFLDTISLSKEGQKIKYKMVSDNKGGYEVVADKKTIWDELRLKTKLSEINWQSMGDQALYRWLITISQKAKYYTTYKDKMNKGNEGQFLDFYGKPDQLAEFIKRVELGERDERIPTGISMLMTIPMLVVAQRAEMLGVVGKQWKASGTKEAWGADLSGWLKEMRGVTSKKDGIQNFNLLMHRLTRFYGFIYARMASLKAEKDIRKKQDEYDEMKEYLNSMGVGLPTQSV